MILDLTNKNKEELLQLAEVTAALRQKHRYRYIDFVMQDKGQYSRDKYKKALEFYKAGKNHHFRLYGGSNGSGKSFGGSLEVVYHLTGEYPEWWEGARQTNPKQWWIVAESGGTFKSSLQRLLLGDSLNEDDLGTGLIPKERLGKLSGWPSISGAVSAFEVKHKNGHWVTVEVKSSDQKRENLQAANLDGVLFDEEPPIDVYTECVFRLRSTSKKPMGISMLLFTPLKGATAVVLQYLDQGQYPNNGQGGESLIDPDKYSIRVEMSEVPHLTDEDRKMYMANCPPHELEARTKGLVALGSGKIYSYPEAQVFCDPFPIPAYWPRCFAIDFGNKTTCVLWGAKDPHTHILYVYAEYYPGAHCTAQIHALNIKTRGKWIPGISDPSGGGTQNDGKQLKDLYIAEGLNLTLGENAVQTGITRNCNMFENGSLKIFNNLEHTKKEYRLYRFDTKQPNIPALNQEDHAMDCLKYLTSRFEWAAKTQEEVELINEDPERDYVSSRDKTTGY